MVERNHAEEKPWPWGFLTMSELEDTLVPCPTKSKSSSCQGCNLTLELFPSLQKGFFRTVSCRDALERPCIGSPFVPNHFRTVSQLLATFGNAIMQNNAGMQIQCKQMLTGMLRPIVYTPSFFFMYWLLTTEFAEHMALSRKASRTLRGFWLKSQAYRSHKQETFLKISSWSADFLPSVQRGTSGALQELKVVVQRKKVRFGLCGGRSRIGSIIPVISGSAGSWSFKSY